MIPLNVKPPNIYEQAIRVQDASNLLGVVYSLHNEILPAVRKESDSTYTINTHPAVRMFAYKIDALANSECMCQRSMQRYGEAYNICEERLAALNTDANGPRFKE